MSDERFGLFDFSKERVRVLHYTWFAFFLTFYIWFNLAPMLSTMVRQLDWLTPEHMKSLIIVNVALTIPARIVVGALIDKYGPRVVFSGLMVLSAIPALIFAFGTSFMQLLISRMLLGTIGAGFVIGIKMVANWWPPQHIGRAEGIYAGFGNFGAAAAAITVPFFAFQVLDSENGWRYSLAVNGVVVGAYGVLYYFLVKDHPEGAVVKKTEKAGPMLVTSYRDLMLYLLFSFPLVGAMALLAGNLGKQRMADGSLLISPSLLYLIWGVLGLIYVAHCMKVLQVNLPHLREGVKESERYPWTSVAALNTTYFANFGAELAVVSMLPWFFETTFSTLRDAAGNAIVTPTVAGFVGGSFAFINLIARPLGGYLSDTMKNRKRTMILYMFGVSAGFFCMGLIGSYGPPGVDGVATLVPAFDGLGWLIMAVIITMFCSFFVQGAEGATFAMIPSIKKEMTGQIAGMAGAYGNVGAVCYLVIYAHVDAKTFFFILATGALVSFFVCLFLLKEPEGSFGDSGLHKRPHTEDAEKSDEAESRGVD